MGRSRSGDIHHVTDWKVVDPAEKLLGELSLDLSLSVSVSLCPFLSYTHTHTPTHRCRRQNLEKAEVLKGFFSSQTILPDCRTSFPDIMSLPQNTRSFNIYHATLKEVFDILSHLKKGKAPGIYDITPDLLLLSTKRIAESFSALFNKSFASSTFPTQLKMALVVPIFKKGDKCNPGNYPPTSLLPVLSKVLERVVSQRLSIFLRPSLIKTQSGFKKADGTVPQLLRFNTRMVNCGG